jgi:acetyltransferase-like isoleucine patch superfamily enzyme
MEDLGHTVGIGFISSWLSGNALRFQGRARIDDGYGINSGRDQAAEGSKSKTHYKGGMGDKVHASLRSSFQRFPHKAPPVARRTPMQSKFTMRLSCIVEKLRKMTNYQRFQLVTSLWTRLKAKTFYPAIFGSFGNSLLFRPMLIVHPEFIHIGNKVLIRPGVRLEALPMSRTPELRIGNNVNIEQNVHIVCHNRVIIGDNVGIAPNCAIVDATHPCDGLMMGEKMADGVQDDDGFIEIGEGAVLGCGVVVLPNVTIGKGCFIGANSTVTRSIPDYSVAVGSPARVIRQIPRLSLAS